MKNNKDKECPLCQVSEETLDKLRGEDKGEKPQEEKPAKKKKGFLSKIWGK